MDNISTKVSLVALKKKNASELQELWFRTGAANVVTDVNTGETLDQKLSDYDVIKIGAALGATALQKHQDISGKADKAETLEGYNITDAYTKAEIDEMFANIAKAEENEF